MLRLPNDWHPRYGQLSKQSAKVASPNCTYTPRSPRLGPEPGLLASLLPFQSMICLAFAAVCLCLTSCPKLENP